MDKQTFNGWTNMGMLYTFARVQQVPDKLLSTFMEIGKYSIGYCRATTNTPAEHGGNRNASFWAKSLGKGKSTFLRCVAELESLGLIKVHTGSQYMLNGGSYPNYYSIVFNQELQTKHKLFFTIVGTTNSPVTEPTPEPEFICPPVEDYFIINGQIALISDPLFAGKLAIATKNGIIPNPTVEQLTNHLRN